MSADLGWFTELYTSQTHKLIWWVLQYNGQVFRPSATFVLLVNGWLCTSAQKLAGGRRNTPMANQANAVRTGTRVIFRAWITDKDGNRVYAKDKGLRAWRIEVPAAKKQ